MTTSLKHPGVEMTLLLGPDQTNGQVCAYVELTDFQAGPPRHIHQHQYELFHVLEGKYHFSLDGEEQILGPGETVVVAPGQTRAFKAVGWPGAKMRFDLVPALHSKDFFARLPRIIRQGGDLGAFFQHDDSQLVGAPLS